MYCVKCGIELSDGQSVCPVCGTGVSHPDIDLTKGAPTYPKIDAPAEEYNKKGILFIITFGFALPFVLSLICDLSLNASIVWSGYVMGILALCYVSIILPIWFKRPNPVVFVPISFAVGALYLFYINYQTNGSWFFTFALPSVGGAMIITTAVITLTKYIKRGRLYIFGGMFISLGAYMVLIEVLTNITFSLRDYLIWSYYPLIILFLIGMMLIITGLVAPLKESLSKMFFLR